MPRFLSWSLVTLEFEAAPWSASSRGLSRFVEACRAIIVEACRAIIVEACRAILLSGTASPGAMDIRRFGAASP
eukprot:7381312-Prymnesium_polylepis.2